MSLPNALPPSLSSRARLRRRVARLAACVLSGAAGVAPAFAQDFSVGFGGGAAKGKVECIDAFACDESSAFWKLAGTWRARPEVELQLSLFGAGKFDGGDTTDLGTPFGGDFKVDGVGLTAGYRWAFAPRWSAVARLGVAAVRTRFHYAAPFDGSKSKTLAEPLGGIGIAYEISPQWRVGIDYDETRFKVHKERGALRMLGVAAQYSF
jgi:hypothetical protein